VLVRRPTPSLPEPRADDKPPQLEPVLDERVFEHILSVIRMQGQQMEQSPALRRTAHAEGFNNQGKTDILIRHEGRNLFICECKFVVHNAAAAELTARTRNDVRHRPPSFAPREPIL
jgi:hypothetical protein